MPIQQGAPAVLRFSFRDINETGTDIGPLDLANPEHLPLRAVLVDPDGERHEVDLDIFSAENGLADYEAAPGELALIGRWRAQGWAGVWPGSVEAFSVVGPNL